MTRFSVSKVPIDYHYRASMHVQFSHSARYYAQNGITPISTISLYNLYHHSTSTEYRFWGRAPFAVILTVIGLVRGTLPNVVPDFRASSAVVGVEPALTSSNGRSCACSVRDEISQYGLGDALSRRAPHKRSTGTCTPIGVPATGGSVS